LNPWGSFRLATLGSSALKNASSLRIEKDITSARGRAINNSLNISTTFFFMMAVLVLQNQQTSLKQSMVSFAYIAKDFILS
jgi:hypothetical protein